MIGPGNRDPGAGLMDFARAHRVLTGGVLGGGALTGAGVVQGGLPNIPAIEGVAKAQEAGPAAGGDPQQAQTAAAAPDIDTQKRAFRESTAGVDPAGIRVRLGSVMAKGVRAFVTAPVNFADNWVINTRNNAPGPADDTTRFGMRKIFAGVQTGKIVGGKLRWGSTYYNSVLDPPRVDRTQSLTASNNVSIGNLTAPVTIPKSARNKNARVRGVQNVYYGVLDQYALPAEQGGGKIEGTKIYTGPSQKLKPSVISPSTKTRS